MPANRSDGLMASNLPSILVSCKCDNPENTRQVSVETMEDACSSCVEAVKTASNVPESARLCLSSMLKAIMASRNGQSHQAHSHVTGFPRFIFHLVSPISIHIEKCSISRARFYCSPVRHPSV